MKIILANSVSPKLSIFSIFDKNYAPPGFSSLVSLPCLLWLMSNSPHQDDPADGTLRQLLCGIHVVSRYTKSYFFNQLFFYSSVWRTFLILYAEGFIRQGKLNLGLFVQLFWVLSISFLMMMFGIFPISLIIRGENFLKAKLRKYSPYLDPFPTQLNANLVTVLFLS